MNNLEATTNEREVLTAEEVKQKATYEALVRLHNNKDFQMVILEGYFVDAAVNLVSMLAHDVTVHNGKRPELVESLIAISRLQDYFRVIRNLGTSMVDSLEDDEEGVAYYE